MIDLGMNYEKTSPQIEEKTLKTKIPHLPVEKAYLVAMSGPHAGTVFTHPRCDGSWAGV